MGTVNYEKNNCISHLTINNPEKRNAIDSDMSDLFIKQLRNFKNDNDSRVLIISGVGDKAFCSGRDLKESLTDRESWDKKPLRGRLYNEIIQTWKPVISAINGSAVGAGCEITLASDIRITRDGCLIGLPEAKRGMGATFGATVLPKIISPGDAARLLYTGDLVDAKEALMMGLVDEVLSSQAELFRRAEELSEKICSCAPLSVQRMKETVWKTMGVPLFQALQLDIGPNVYESEDREEGSRAFLEKRRPLWKGR